MAWQEEALWTLKLSSKERKTLKKVSVAEITWYFSDKRKHDIDAGIKILLDTIVKAGLVEDDDVFTELHVYKEKTSKKNYCTLNLY